MKIGAWLRFISLATVIVFIGVAASAQAAPRAKLIEFWDDEESESRLNIDHRRWDALLKKHVETNHASGINRIDYAAFSAADKASLGEYLEYLQLLDPRQVNLANQKAYWLNLYNAGIVALVLDKDANADFDSIKDLGNIWKKKRFYIAMQNTSFDDIQHGVLRSRFNDNRLLFGINAGTLGSAPIQPAAFTHENVEELLDVVLRDFFATSTGLSTDGDTITITKSLKWYASDYGGRDGALEFVKKYSSPAKVGAIERSRKVDYDYDWSLNKP